MASERSRQLKNQLKTAARWGEGEPITSSKIPAKDQGSASPKDRGKKPSICRGTPAEEPGNSIPRGRGMPGSSIGEKLLPGTPGRRAEAPTGSPSAVAGSGTEGLTTPLRSSVRREMWRDMRPSIGETGNTGWWDTSSLAAGQMDPRGKGCGPKGGFPERASRGMAQGGHPFQTPVRQTGKEEPSARPRGPGRQDPRGPSVDADLLCLVSFLNYG